jgi:hypothetical protein
MLCPNSLEQAAQRLNINTRAYAIKAKEIFLEKNGVPEST